MTAFFAIGLVVFLLAFVGYIICALVALVLDVQVFLFFLLCFLLAFCRLHDLCARGIDGFEMYIYILVLDAQAQGRGQRMRRELRTDF